MQFRAFPEQVGPQILSLGRVDNFGTSEHFSGRKNTNLISNTLITSVVNFHCMQMSLVMSMRFIFTVDWNDMLHVTQEKITDSRFWIFLGI